MQRYRVSSAAATTKAVLNCAQMPVRSVIFKEQRLVFTIEDGCVTFADMWANHDRLLADPDFNPEFNQLVDASLATETDLMADNIRTLYKRRVFATTSRRAVVAGNEFAYGMARMIQTYSDLSENPSNVAVFRDRASALQWLGLSENSLRQDRVGP